MATFTMIAEHAGGLYVSQVVARDVSEAVVAWTRRTKMGRHFRRAFEDERELGGSRPQPVGRLSNVWCQSALHEDALVLLNVVKTVPAARGR